MEIQTRTVRVLEKTVPQWLKKLCTAGFDAANLSHKDRTILAGDGECCMLGEMYDMTNSYFAGDSDDNCSVCESFSNSIPRNLGIGDYGFDDSEDTINRDYTTKDILSVLDEFALHIQESHTDKMQKAIVPNEC
jgi:hypothetical protein